MQGFLGPGVHIRPLSDDSATCRLSRRSVAEMLGGLPARPNGATLDNTVGQPVSRGGRAPSGEGGRGVYHRVDTLSAGWRASAEQAARRFAVISALGGLLGALVGGVGGRLAMMLLARLNPEATSVMRDDGFRIGQFTLSDTLGLLLVGAGFGLAGAGVYSFVRGLMIGPHWFQVLSVAGGPAVVVGAVLVHTNGVDFRLLGPAWLAIGLFVAIPGV